MNYVRKPDREKRGNGKTRAGVGTKIVFPSAPSMTPHLSEDRPAFERHIKRLTLECNKRHNSNQEVIAIYIIIVMITILSDQITKSLMLKTFGFRRTDILESITPILDIVAKYPPLAEPTEVHVLFQHNNYIHV